MSAPVTVFALVTDAFGGRGGIAQYNRDFLGALAESGLVSAVEVLPRHAPDEVSLPAGIRQASAVDGRIAYSAAAIRTALKRRADIVFCGHLYMAPLAAVVARLCGAKLIVQMHGIEAWSRPSVLRRVATDAADVVLCVSRYTRAQALSWATIEPEWAIVLPNTVSETFIPGDGAALRTAWGLNDTRVLLTVGRMDTAEQYKGHERVIAAMPEIIARGHNVCYVVVGDGSDRPRLETLAAKSGVAKRVRFMGMVDEATLRSAYQMADLFVMPSTGEGFGIAFLEAMASGTPALGLAVGGARDALADGELGAAVDERDFVTALTHAIERPKPDGEVLATAVRVRFGRERFVSGVRAVINRMAETRQQRLTQRIA